MSKLVDFLKLPGEISSFEATYLKRLNKVGLAFLAAHVPLYGVIAWANHTGPWTALALTLLVLVGPVVAWLRFENPRAVSMIFGVAAMCMGGLLVHFGQGPMQIEMHFYFFAVVAMLAVYGNPLVIVAAATTVAVHHLLVWLALPASVFNYAAPVWVVGLHAAFLVLESIATCFIARSFFDNVIGLEKVVAARTKALDRRNEDMRLVLDNVKQGFATIDPAGVLAPERSAAFDAWFGRETKGTTIFDLFAASAPEFAARSRRGWIEVSDGVMPLALTLDQMPIALKFKDQELSVEYRPIGEGETPAGFLVVVTDVSAERQRERADLQQREGLNLFERLVADRSGFTSFFENASELVVHVTGPSLDHDLAAYKRELHTLKGNCAIFGLESVAQICHELETYLADEGQPPPREQREVLVQRWSGLASQMDRLLGARRDIIEVEPAEHALLEAAIRRGIAQPELLRKVHELKLDSTQRRLDGFAAQAKRIAERLEKGAIEVKVEANGLRVDAAHWGGFWSAFVHALRNAVDHGLETPDERARAGKDDTAQITLRTFAEGPSFIVEIEDNGRGIDWDKVTAKARAMGIVGKSNAELLLVDGLSTAAQVTDLSGRGVGLGALHEVTTALGGTFDIISELGAGTRVRMAFPEHATMPRLYDYDVAPLSAAA